MLELGPVTASPDASSPGGQLPGAADLPQVLHGAPAAVLLIDLDRRRVVYANSAAVELAGERIGLPVDVDTWSDAAGLTDLGGRPLSETTSPLSLVAAGTPVAGEPVAVREPARSGASDGAGPEAAEGRLLWVTGFLLADGTAGRDRAGVDGAELHGDEMDDAALDAVMEDVALDAARDGAGLASLALVVFLQLSGTTLGDQRRLALLRDRAVIATEMSFTITDPRRPDDPLVWVNPSFTRLTGYRPEEVVGRNCRLLQGPNTDPAAIRRMSDALRRHEPITEVLLNYRRDGTAYWNQVSISPVTDGSGDLVNFVGVQSDVTERVLVEQDRRTALAEAEEARAQLRLLAEATTQMTEAYDVADACTRLARIAVPQLADLCAVDLSEHPGRGPVRRVAVAARDAADEELMVALAARHDYAPGPGGAPGGDAPVLLAELPERGADRYPDEPAAAEIFDRLRLRSALVVPVRARGRVLGALTLATQHPYGRRYGPRDLHLVTDLAGRAGLTIDNARLYEVEHTAAVTLQRSLLPAVPDVAGLQVAARYLVGVDGNQVGGDWYDVLPLPDGAIGIAVGDVVGHDLRAAAAMGQLRGIVQSYAWDGDRPGSVLDRCDQLVQGLEMDTLATAVYARLEPPDEHGTRLLRYANAGHPAPLLVTPADGLVRLDGDRSPMIGVVPPGTARRDEAEVRCPPGSLVLLYTDGLTDVAGYDPDERTALVERTVAAVPPGASAQTVVDAVLSACMPERLTDDVALLAVRVDG